MEFQKIKHFLNTTSDENSERCSLKDLARFVTKKWVRVYDQSGGNYNVNEEIRIKTSMLGLDLCGFNDAYNVVKGTITVDKKRFTANGFNAANNTAANATSSNIANYNTNYKSWFLKTMHHLLTAFQKLMA